MPETKKPKAAPSTPLTPALLRPAVRPRWAEIPVPPSALPASAAAGLVAAVLLPLDRPGIGWVLTGLAVMVAVVESHRRSRQADAPRHFTRMSPVWAVAALALLAAGFVRASGWLFALCVIAAGVAGSLAVVGGRTARSLLFEVFAVPTQLVSGGLWVLRSARPRPDNGARRRVGISVLASVALLAVFIPLLSGADAAFARLMESLVPDLDTGTFLGWALAFAVAGAWVAGACFLLASPPEPEDADKPRKRLAHRVEWALPLSVLVALFAVFVAVRLVSLFGGSDYMRRTEGLTAADYARGGFWQLCVATALTLVLVGAGLRWAPNGTKADRVWQRVLLGGLSGFSLVLVASALSRMSTYQQAYGFTVLRLLVQACELWLGAVFVLVLVCLVRLRPAWLPRSAVGAAVLALLALVALDPERFIADRNIDRAAEGRTLDVLYLSRFSADVVPAVERLPERQRACVLRIMADRLDDELDGDSWAAWYLSRSAATEILLDHAPDTRGDDLPQDSRSKPSSGCFPST